MLVSKISFTSESNLLNRISQNPIMQELKPEETSSPVVLQSVKSHKVRNWSIGMGSAAVLIGLGVLGRRGNLGEGVQKLLGGVKKNANNMAELLETKINEAGLELPKSSTLPKVVIDIEKINASLNRTIPKIDAPVKTDIPDIKYLVNEFRNMDVSSFKDNYNKIKLPNGNTREIFLTSDNKHVACIFDTNNSGERVLEAKFINREFLDIKKGNEIYNFRGADLCRYAVGKDGKIYNYNADGAITYISEFNETGIVTRIIHLANGTDRVSNIVYIDPDTSKIIKQDVFNNGNIVDEVFYGNQGEVIQ